jgi:hypothetical protein
MTGNGATTSTPENSEAPRESRGDLGLVERFDAARNIAEKRDANVYEGTPAMVERLQALGKVSSPELASLAAKYVNIDTLELMDLDHTAAFELCMDVRSLAASVLTQAEGTPRK